MALEQANTPSAPTIDPYISPAYWGGRHIGDGSAVPWPDVGEEVGPKDGIVGFATLVLFAQKGARRIASSRLFPDDRFEAGNYKPGTVLLTPSTRC